MLEQVNLPHYNVHDPNAYVLVTLEYEPNLKQKPSNSNYSVSNYVNICVYPVRYA